ncbi:MAG: hypothetical protein Q9167_000361 [Letrouitia subvulpina]
MFQPSTSSILGVTGSEDPMELSLDTDRRVTGDEDIEIDLDLAGDPTTGPDDDDMVEYDGGVMVQDQGKDIFTGTDEQMIDEPSNDVEEPLDHTAELPSISDEDFNEVVVSVPEADQNAIPNQSEQPVPHKADESFLSNLQPGNQNPDDQEHQADLENDDPDIDGHNLGSLNAEESVDQHAVDQSLATTSPEVLDIAPGDNVPPTSDVEEYYDDDDGDDESKQFDLLDDTVADITGFNEPSNFSSEMPRIHQGQDENSNGRMDSSLPEEKSQIRSTITIAPPSIPEQYANEESAARDELYAVTAPSKGQFETIETSITNGEDLDFAQVGLEQVEENLDHDEFENQDKSDLHPVLVNYQDNEISLFPPKNDQLDDSQTYFLQDERYAWDSLHDLLNACKTILEEDIEEYEELEITFQGLDLRINQSCVEGTNTSLAEILDIHTQLHYQDNNEYAPPLMINLSTKAQFSKRLEYLRETAAEGKGFSRLKPLEKPTNDGFLAEQSAVSQAINNKEQSSADILNQREDTGDKVEKGPLDSGSPRDGQFDQGITQAKENSQIANSPSPELDRDQFLANSKGIDSGDHGKISDASNNFSASSPQPAHTKDDSPQRSDPHRTAEDGILEDIKDDEISYNAVELEPDTVFKNPETLENPTLIKEDYDTAEDEITYEDEYEDEDEVRIENGKEKEKENENINLDTTTQAASSSWQNISLSPNSLKRTRNDPDNDPLDQEAQVPKRVRSQ